MFKAIKGIFASSKKKSNVTTVPSTPLSFADFLIGRGHGALSTYVQTQYFEQCSPLFNAVEIIFSECQSIPIRVRNKKTKEVMFEHPALDLLNRPNCDYTKEEFIEQCISFKLINNNVGIVATGDLKRPPLELYVYGQQSITAGTADTSCAGIVPINYTVNNGVISEVYTNNEIKGRSVFLNEDRDQEFWLWRSFNPRQNGSDFFGMSKLRPLFYDIEQFINASKHNKSLLERGGRPSALIGVEQDISNEDYEILVRELKAYQGGENAGRMMIIPSGRTFKELSQTNKDMDFKELKKELKEAIYNVYRIPLAMISSETMTMDNLKVAKLDLYDNAVLPVFRRFLSELTELILPRYPDGANLEFCYLDDDIPALAMRKMETIAEKNRLGVLTQNEIRNDLGYEPFEGGDTHYINSVMFPVNMPRNLPTERYQDNNTEGPQPNGEDGQEDDSIDEQVKRLVKGFLNDKS